MEHVHTATRVFLDEDTRIEERREITILWATVLYVEDVSYLWPNLPAVTGITLDTEEKIHTIEDPHHFRTKWCKYLDAVTRLNLTCFN